ncbi:unnamed protein product [Pleuronectes platessa]|uniref:Uncharacterized protein n=1 Tax=Pleuronectes platessa TaxID=8262 RepID=A0A9N7VDM1_PLEPL|nr:unnamed protein product [Pleuronectes platessa]
MRHSVSEQTQWPKFQRSGSIHRGLRRTHTGYTDNASVINPGVRASLSCCISVGLHRAARWISHSSLFLSLFGPRYLHPLLSISQSSSLHLSPPFSFLSPCGLRFISPIHPHHHHHPRIRFPPPPPPPIPQLPLNPPPPPLLCPSFNPSPLLLLLLPFSPAILQASGARLQAFRESLDLLGSG